METWFYNGVAFAINTHTHTYTSIAEDTKRRKKAFCSRPFYTWEWTHNTVLEGVSQWLPGRFWFPFLLLLLSWMGRKYGDLQWAMIPRMAKQGVRKPLKHWLHGASCTSLRMPHWPACYGRKSKFQCGDIPAPRSLIFVGKKWSLTNRPLQKPWFP